MKLRDLAGLRFNDLSVVEHVGKSESGQTLFKCRCDCGKECIKLSVCLVTGVSKDCGCKKQQRLTLSKLLGWEVFAKEITTKFPHYYVLDYSDGRCSSKWRFKCSVCSEVFEASPNYLKRSGNCYFCSCRHIYREDAVEVIHRIQDLCVKLDVSFVKWDDSVYKGRAVSTITIKCNKHLSVKSVTVSEFLNKESGLKCCSIKGFKDDIPAVFYVTKWSLDEDCFYKYGITSNYRKREVNQSRRTDYKPENVINISFNRGIHARMLETNLHSFCGTGLVPKKLFKDGYTETFSEDKLDAVLNIIQDYTRRFEYEFVQHY